MKKVFTILLISILGSSLWTFAAPRTEGSGNVVKEERNVKSFTGIRAGGAFKVFITQGSPQSVVVEIDDNLIDLISTEVKANILEIKNKGNINNPTKMNIYITVKELTNLDLSGASEAILKTPINAGKKMKIDMYGASKIKDGVINANQMKVDMSGASSIDAAITCKTLKIDASGASKTNFSGTATKKSISASGAAKVAVEGLKSEESDITAIGAAKVTTGEGGRLSKSVTSAASIKIK